jgi:hypothetical protein
MEKHRPVTTRAGTALNSVEIVCMVRVEEVQQNLLVPFVKGWKATKGMQGPSNLVANSWAVDQTPNECMCLLQHTMPKRPSPHDHEIASAAARLRFRPSCFCNCMLSSRYISRDLENRSKRLMSAITCSTHPGSQHSGQCGGTARSTRV